MLLLHLPTLTFRRSAPPPEHVPIHPLELRNGSPPGVALEGQRGTADGTVSEGGHKPYQRSIYPPLQMGVTQGWVGAVVETVPYPGSPPMTHPGTSAAAGAQHAAPAPGNPGWMVAAADPVGASTAHQTRTSPPLTLANGSVQNVVRAP